MSRNLCLAALAKIAIASRIKIISYQFYKDCSIKHKWIVLLFCKLLIIAVYSIFINTCRPDILVYIFTKSLSGYADVTGSNESAYLTLIN